MNTIAQTLYSCLSMPAYALRDSDDVQKEIDTNTEENEGLEKEKEAKEKREGEEE